MNLCIHNEGKQIPDNNIQILLSRFSPVVKSQLVGLLILVLAIIGADFPAHAEQTWTTLTDPAEVAETLSGRAFKIKKEYDVYYRKDGNVAEFDPTYNSMSLRK